MFTKGLFWHAARAICVACLTTPLYAANVWFARDMPMSQMTEADIEILSSAADAALEEAADGETRHWENPETGAGGALTPLSTSERDGMRCRRLQIANEAGGKSARSEFDFCRQDDGSWKVLSEPAAAGSPTQ
jgi:surface antigen